MNSSEIKYSSDINSNDLELNELIYRVILGRASWKDIHKHSGVYVVYHKNPSKIKFNSHGGISNCKTLNVEILQRKWARLSSYNLSDIIYIGRGNVRARVRSLIRFGLGKAVNHKGGEWLWQVDDYSNLKILISSCPTNKENAYEKFLLDTFKEQHGDWPLANRTGGQGSEIWIPLNCT